MSENAYTTLDCYQAGYLVLQGHVPDLLNEGQKIVFAFKNTPALFKHISDYQNGSKIEAVKLANAIKLLKSQIFSRKKNGEWHGYGKTHSF